MRWVGGLVAVLTLSSPIQGQPVPAGYYLDSSVPRVDSYSWTDGQSLIEIRREAPDSSLLVLIETAESLYPTSDRIEEGNEAFLNATSSADEIVPRETRLKNLLAATARIDSTRSEPKWWWRANDDDPIPFSITRGTLAHYHRRAQELAADTSVARMISIDEETGEETVLFEQESSGELVYSARVIPVSSEDGTRYRVSMEFSFIDRSGVWGGGGTVYAQRSVFFDAELRPIRVLGDGDAFWTYH